MDEQVSLLQTQMNQLLEYTQFAKLKDQKGYTSNQDQVIKQCSELFYDKLIKSDIFVKVVQGVSMNIVQEREKQIKKESNDMLHIRTSAMEMRNRREFQDIRKSTDAVDEIKQILLRLNDLVEKKANLSELISFKSEVYQNFSTISDLNEVKEQLREKCSIKDNLNLAMEFDQQKKNIDYMQKQIEDKILDLRIREKEITQEIQGYYQVTRDFDQTVKVMVDKVNDRIAHQELKEYRDIDSLQTQLNQQNKLNETFVPKSDLDYFREKIQNLATIKSLEDMRNEFKPRIERNGLMLSNFRADNDQMKDCIRVFDNTLSLKANKASLQELEEYSRNSYVLKKDFTDYMTRAEEYRKACLKKSDLPTTGKQLDELINGICTYIVEKRVRKFDDICKNFQGFFNQEDLKEKLSQKADLKMIKQIQEEKLGKKEIISIEDRLENHYQMIQQISILQNQMAINNSNKTDPINKKIQDRDNIAHLALLSQNWILGVKKCNKKQSRLSVSDLKLDQNNSRNSIIGVCDQDISDTYQTIKSRPTTGFSGLKKRASISSNFIQTLTQETPRTLTLTSMPKNMLVHVKQRQQYQRKQTKILRKNKIAASHSVDNSVNCIGLGVTLNNNSTISDIFKKPPIIKVSQGTCVDDLDL